MNLRTDQIESSEVSSDKNIVILDPAEYKYKVGSIVYFMHGKGQLVKSKVISISIVNHITISDKGIKNRRDVSYTVTGRQALISEACVHSDIRDMPVEDLTNKI